MHAVPELGDASRCAIERIVAARAARVPISPLVTAAASSLGVEPRTVWRWLANGPPGQQPSRAWRPSETDVDAYVRWKGNAAAAWRERQSEDATVPELRSFQAALVRGLSPGDRAAIRDGVEGRRRHQVYLRWEPEARNQLWEADHKQLDVPVLFPRRQRPAQPWSTLFVDGFSRAVMGWAISDCPSSGTVLAALGAAIRVDDDRGPFAGLPATLRPDRGLEFAADALEQACGVLGVALVPTPPFSPHLKGKVERLHRSIVTDLLAELPHFTGGPRDAAGKLWGRGEEVLTLAELVERFDSWVRRYNRERAHDGLGSQTPLQRWSEDATPLRLVPDADLRWTLLAGKRRIIRTSGVSFNGLSAGWRRS
jgi:putative transposase